MFQHRNELDDVPMLAELLSARGYDTAAFVDGGQMSESFGMTKGFDSWFDTGGVHVGGAQVGGGLAEITPQVISWLEEQVQTTFFALIHNRVFDVQLRVPLIVRLPTRRHQEIGGPVQLIDLLPTLLGMLGVEAPEGLPGMDLRPAVARGRLDPQRLRYAENGKAQTLRMDQRWTLIMDQGIPRGLYDLRADPEETEDLIEQHPEIADRLRGAFEQFTVSGDPLRSFPDDLSEEEIDRLRSLGYLR